MTLSRIDIALSLTPAGLQVWLALILKNRHLIRRFRFFLLYTCWSILAQISLVLVGVLTPYRVFFLTYSIALGVNALFGILAMEESFRNVLGEYYRGKRWFKGLVPGVVLAAAGTVIWQWFKHAPVQSSPLLQAYISLSLASDYVLAAIFGLFVVMVIVWHTSPDQYEFGVMAGFGLSSIAGMLADLLRSDFGTRWNSFFVYLPPVAYILACWTWLAAFSRPERRGGLKGPGESVRSDDLLRFLRKLKRVIK